MTQAENDLAELCQAQSEALEECREERSQLRWACIHALINCDGCIGRLSAEKVSSILMKALGEETDDA